MSPDNAAANLDPPSRLTPDEALALLPSWTTSLKASRRSPNTIKSYVSGARLYLTWVASLGLPEALDRRSVQAWLAELSEQGLEGATVASRQAAVRAYSAWLADEEEIPRDQLRTLPAVKVDAKPVPAFTDAELAALLKACRGKELNDRRDEALFRLLVDVGGRANEVLGIDLVDLDITECRVVLRKGKGGKVRTVPFGASTAAALDRYVRARRQHPHAGSPALFLGRSGRLSYEGFRDAFQARGKAAGVKLHLHKFRHTAMTRWVDAGGSEAGMVALAGWSNRNMVDRYTKHSAERRLAEERGRLELPEL